MKPAKNSTQKSPKSATATGEKSKGFTDEERAAMREYLQERNADSRGGRRADKADEEGIYASDPARWMHKIILFRSCYYNCI